MLWCSVYLYYTAFPESRFCALPSCTNFSYGFKAFNLFKLLENETSKIFSIWERRKSRHKFGTDVYKAEEVRKYFVNTKIEIYVFSYVICSLAFKMSHAISFDCMWKWWMVSFRGTYWLSIIYFILLCVFLCLSFLFLFFLAFCEFYYLLRYLGKFSDT